MRYLSVCSGIEAASVAWEPLGWKPAAFSEIEAFPRAVLRHHYPHVPLHGDFTTIGGDEYGPIDLLVGGTPCQSFSVAGLRAGLADDRGNLALEFLRLARRTRAKWLVWENVPGVLSSNGGRDFGSILGGMVELGYGIAYRVLDAQHFGVPQRRRRVFVVGYLGDWRRAAAVLFERHGLQGHSPPRREAGQGSAGRAGEGVVGSLCADSHPGAYSGQDAYTGRLIAHSLRGEGFDASEDGTGRGTPLVPVQAVIASLELSNQGSGGNVGWHAPDRPTKTLDTNCPPGVAIAFTAKDHGADGSHANGGVMPAVAFPVVNMAGGKGQAAISDNLSPTLGAYENGGHAFISASAVRRLTPVECERLQGFPDSWTLIPWRGRPASECPDGPRYKALGNSMAVPVMAWIGRRIAAVEALPSGAAAGVTAARLDAIEREVAAIRKEAVQ